MISTATARRIETARIADQLERSFRGGAWHGPALAQALADVDPASARRRPLAGAHTIWEIARHAAVWIDVARRRIAGEADAEAPAELDWAAATDLSEDAWRETLAALERAHDDLHATVVALEDGRLDDPVAGCDPTVRGLLLGVLQHNGYHAGQIVLLKKAGVAGGAVS